MYPSPVFFFYLQVKATHQLLQKKNKIKGNSMCGMLFSRSFPSHISLGSGFGLQYIHVGGGGQLTDWVTQWT